MNGISSSGKNRISSIVEDMFDRIALQFLGRIPKLRNTKSLFISGQSNLGLPNLFVQAMRNRTPNELEQDFLKSLLTSAHGYIEAAKSNTAANITERLDGLAREAALNNEKIAAEKIQEALDDEMKKARSKIVAIAESESTKLRNLGNMVDIGRVSADLGDPDPTVFFIVVKDGVTCKECIRLHLADDQVTPRLWKLSELKQSYHKRGEDSPSAFGLHPHCRCTLTYLSKGFGFDEKGKIKYIAQYHDAHAAQE